MEADYEMIFSIKIINFIVLQHLKTFLLFK